MHHRLVLAAIACLFAEGCAKHSATVVEGNPFTSRKVYVWNGKTCNEEMRTQEQLQKSSILKAVVIDNGERKWVELVTENVPRAEFQKVFSEGGTIDLPNGDQLRFPPDVATQSSITSTGQATLENGKKVSYDGGMVSGLVPELIKAKGRATLDDANPGHVAPSNGISAKQTVVLDNHGANGADLDFTEPSIAPPDKSEWWNALPSAPPAAKDGIKVPPQSSVNGRVGSVSMSYGMGQISKP